MSDEALNERQRANEELVRKGLEAFNSGDLEASLAFLDPNVEVHTDSALINTGTYHGHAGFFEWMRLWLEAWESFEPEILAIHAIGDAFVVVDIHQTAVGAASGVEVTMDLAYMFEVANDRAARIHLYPNREQAVAVAKRLGT